jgi:hypothetical protein
MLEQSVKQAVEQFQSLSGNSEFCSVRILRPFQDLLTVSIPFREFRVLQRTLTYGPPSAGMFQSLSGNSEFCSGCRIRP